MDECGVVLQKPKSPEKIAIDAILRRRKNFESNRLSRPEITDKHVRMVWQEVHERHSEFPTFDEDEMVSDGFWGLCMAWILYDEIKGGGAPFEYFARLKIKTYIWNGIRREMNRRRILNPRVLSAVLEAAEESGEYPSQLVVYDISEVVVNYDELMVLLRELKKEPMVTQEAVLRTEKDYLLAQKYGFKSQASILHKRRNFLTKFLKKVGR